MQNIMCVCLSASNLQQHHHHHQHCSHHNERVKMSILDRYQTHTLWLGEESTSNGINFTVCYPYLGVCMYYIQMIRSHTNSIKSACTQGDNLFFAIIIDHVSSFRRPPSRKMALHSPLIISHYHILRRSNANQIRNRKCCHFFYDDGAAVLCSRIANAKL